LDSFVLDYDNSDAELEWTCVGNVDLSVYISPQHTAYLAIPYLWTGQETITFTATDPAGLSGECSVRFTVNPVIHDPLIRDDWPVSTPDEQGLDFDAVHRMYLEAMRLDHLYSLLIIKNGYLVAERYFNGVTVDLAKPIASVTKSYTSALAGLALREGHFTGLDDKMADFFPELDWTSADPRKSDITLRQMLQMRSGYPYEDEATWEILNDNWDNWCPLLVEMPLTSEPGAEFAYSCLTSHMLAVIVARASNTDLLSFARTFLFDPLECGDVIWPTDPQGYYLGHGDARVRPRDMAKLGLLFVNGGVYKGTQVIPAEWVTESLTPYSHNVYGGDILEHMTNISYGYMWWTAEAGSHEVWMARGSCGQLIAMVPDLDMVVVTSAEIIYIFDPDAWPRNRAILEMVGEFISSQ
jgi:CubicO group peptidase (beta-lactamase class C family)